MPCCGGSGTSGCSCRIEAGPYIEVTGNGSPTEPFVISGEPLAVVDSTDFNLSLVDGVLTVTYATGAKLDSIPDVNAPTPANGEVLTWDTASSKWVAGPPATASPGAVQHDASLAGDGSGGSPLQVNESVSGFLSTDPVNGLGINTPGVNQMNRKYPHNTARNADFVTRPPTVNTISSVDSEVGRFSYWSGDGVGGGLRDIPGTNWVNAAINGVLMQVAGPEYDSTRRLIHYMDFQTQASESDGTFIVIDTEVMETCNGVLVCHVQPTGTGTPWVPMVFADTVNTLVKAKGIRVSDGASIGSTSITYTVQAWLYI